MGLIDSHCHLNYDYSPKTVDQIVQEAELAGVESLITIGTEIKTLSAIQKISDTYPNVWHTVGVHPHEAVTLEDKDIAILEQHAKHPKCRAIGEIGLDYHYQHSPREAQILRLEQQLELALRLKLPVVIHAREAEEDLGKILTSYSAKVEQGQIPGVIHCFSGTVPFGKLCLDLGFYISFSGILTFKKADEIKTAAKLFPLDRILVETDSPYLAPMPFRGKKCEPSMVKLTAEKLAEIKGSEFEVVANQTTLNAKKLFRLD